MIAIIKGIYSHRCSGCYQNIEKRTYKVKDSQDNANRKYYHLHCVPRHIAHEQSRLWQLTLNEQTEAQL